MTESKILDSTNVLKELVEIPSPIGSESEAVTYLVGIMKKLGMDAHIDEIGNAIGSTGGEGTEILLVGHIDTVAGELPVEEVDGELWGRGTVDAKGPLCTMVFAASKFTGRKDINITVIGAIDEEGSSKGARSLKDQYKPDLIIIGEPSGWDGICIGYKGHMLVNYSVTRPNVHGAHPEPNAIDVALSYFAEVKNYCDSFKEEEPKPLFEILTVSPRDIKISRDSKEQKIEMDIDFRLPVDFPIPLLEGKLKELNKGGELTFNHVDTAVLVDKNNQLVRSFLKAIRDHDGEPRFKKKTGTSDMNVLANFWDVPIVSYGPGDSSLDHSGNEHVELDEFEKSISVLTDVLKALN